MDRFEIRLTIDRALDGVFAVYTQPDTWRWCSYIRRVRWVRGKPWEIESRLRVETTHSIHVPVDQVVMHYEPRRRIDYICHFGGITLQSRQDFLALSGGVTEVHNQSEFVGTFSRVAGYAIGTQIEQRTREFLEDLKRECERVIPAAALVESQRRSVADQATGEAGDRQ